MKFLTVVLPGLAVLLLCQQNAWAQGYGQAYSQPYQGQPQYQGQQQFQGQPQAQGGYYQSPDQAAQNYGAAYSGSGQTAGGDQTYFGAAQKSQMASDGTGYDANGSQSAPGSFLDDSSQTGGQSDNQTGNFSDDASGGSGKGEMVKGAAGKIGKLLGKGIGVAAPVAGALYLSKTAANNGYGNNVYANPYGAVNPYANPYAAANPYNNPYASPYGYGNPYATANPYAYGQQASPYGYPVQPQSTGSALINTGIRALFGGN